ncbi:hypothetical protein [Denitratimonas sp. CY0512]|uniref:hypothetical protein n=1 Tax=Denitratimonas sp. CY0512 TaxID=3131940 RepID=UPI00309FC17F
MMSRNLLLVAVAGVMAGWLSNANAEPKNVILTVDDGELIVIPLDHTKSAGFNSNGDFVASCDLGDGGKCPNIGSSADGELLKPSLTSSGPSGVVAANDTTSRLHWTVANAHACYGLGAQSGVSGWGVVWPASATSGTAGSGFPLSGLTRHATNNTTYDFTLRCYSGSSATVGGDGVVAYEDFPLSVQLAPSGGTTPPPAGNCAAYLASLGDPSDPGSPRAHYDAYDAGKRGFTSAGTFTFTQKTGRTLGKDAGLIASPPVLPGSLSDNQYLALSFTLPNASEENTGKFNVQFMPPIGVGKEHRVVATISPCPGDFRPRDQNSTDPYLTTFCRQPYSMTGSVRGNTVDDTFRCKLPANQTLYINIALRDLFSSGDASTLPPDECSTGQICGAGAELQK